MKKKVFYLSLFMLAVLYVTGLQGSMQVVNAATSGFWKYTVWQGTTLHIDGYTGAAANVVIPDKIGGLPVTELGYSAFNGNQWIVSVTIPKSVTDIRQYCFNNCSNLTTVKGMENVTGIQREAFCGCSSLKSIVFNKSSKLYIYEYAFSGCTSLTSIE